MRIILPRSRRRRRASSALLLAATLLWLLLPASAGASSSVEPAGKSQPAPTGAPTPVLLQVRQSDPGRPVPARFMGLSFEVRALSELARDGSQGNLVTLLRSLGPGMLRFGGVTADENVGWTDAATPPEPWASSFIGPPDMRALAELARRSGWTVLLTVGLAHYEPQTAAREVAAAHEALGASLAGIEIGNEPDALGHHGYREEPWSSQSYAENVLDYREAIDRLTPGISIAGPDVSGSSIFPDWGYAEAAGQQPALLTGHHYPLGCAHQPSIPRLLSPETRGLEAHSLNTYLRVSRAWSIPFRLDETNSVSCGGVPGISNTFASALWASGYVTETMAAGAVGINMQGNPDNCPGYTPICATDPVAAAAGQLTARPDWYALELAHVLIGDRPLLTRILTAPAPNLVAYAFRTPRRGLSLVLVDDETPSSAPLSIRLAVGSRLGAGHVLRLSGPSQEATSGVQLGGRTLNTDGSLPAPAHPERATVSAGYLNVVLAPSSAALVTLDAPAPRRQRRHG